jgi:diguanylate cyclase (GGDEF)-like protein
VEALRARPRSAQLFLLLVYGLAVGALAAMLSAPRWLGAATVDGHGGHWLGPVLAALACVAAYDVVPWWQPPRRTGEHDEQTSGCTYADVAGVFFGLGVLLLGPVGAVLLTLPARLVEVTRVRSSAYKHLYNAATYVLSTSAGWAVFHLALHGFGLRSSDVERPGWLVAAAAGALTLLMLDLGGAVGGRRAMHGLGSPLREVGQVYPLWTQTAAGALAVLIALLWNEHPWLVVTTVFPLLVLRRALHLRDLELASRTDPKTGLANYGWFQEVADREVRRALRNDTALSLLVLDLDHLREVNTAHGHLAGDVVLKGVADVLASGVREFDLVCRFGGEEFLVLLPSTGLAEAQVIAERLRSAVHDRTFHAATATRPLAATVSVGVSLLGDHGATLEELLHAADIAVYRAKATGRNQVCVAEAGPAQASETDAWR